MICRKGFLGVAAALVMFFASTTEAKAQWRMCNKGGGCGFSWGIGFKCWNPMSCWQPQQYSCQRQYAPPPCQYHFAPQYAPIQPLPCSNGNCGVPINVNVSVGCPTGSCSTGSCPPKFVVPALQPK